MNKVSSNVASSALPPKADAQLQQLLSADLAQLTLRDLLGMTLSSLAEAERKQYLAHHETDRGNGHYQRGLNVGSVPVDVTVPRTRGGFRPALLPPPYQRGYGEEHQSLLLGLLASSRSLNAAKTSLRQMGLSCDETQLEQVAQHFVEECELRNHRPIAPDQLVIWFDGKYVEIRDGDKLRPATLYLVIGLGQDGIKRVLCCNIRLERESKEGWKLVLNRLFERGMRRVMLVIHDDLTGLLGLTKGMFPQSDVQLCTVHMMRNSKSHLPKADAAHFIESTRAIFNACDIDVARQQFDELCTAMKSNAPAFIAHIEKRKEHYLNFINYPDPLRHSLKTTNAVEAVNTQLERMRLNNGGYFHSDDTLKLKLGITLSNLESGKWKKVAAKTAAALSQLNAMFIRKFEVEL